MCGRAMHLETHHTGRYMYTVLVLDRPFVLWENIASQGVYLRWVHKKLSSTKHLLHIYVHKLVSYSNCFENISKIYIYKVFGYGGHKRYGPKRGRGRCVIYLFIDMSDDAVYVCARGFCVFMRAGEKCHGTVRYRYLVCVWSDIYILLLSSAK